MNNFHDILLPDFISIHLKGGPVFATNIAASISGREIRITEREYSMQKYIISGCKLSENQFQDFNCFFRSRKGCSHAFRMRDYADYKIENQVVEPRSDQSLELELFKKYDDYYRRITTIRNGTVKSNIELKNIDYINGIISLYQPLNIGENLIISAEFDIAARFSKDEFKYAFCQDGAVLIEELELQEVLL